MIEQDLPSAAGSRRGPVLVIGVGDTLWADAAPWRDRAWPVMAVNHAGVLWPGELAHWASLHAELLWAWALLKNRVRHNGEYRPLLPGTVFHAPRAAHGVGAQVWRFADNQGFSTLFAVRVCLLLGYDRVVLAGCPHTGRRLTDCPWVDYPDYGEEAGWHAWEAHALRFNDRVRSMSGRTMDLLGAPDRWWLDAAESPA